MRRDQRTVVRTRYAKIAERNESTESESCCASGSGDCSCGTQRGSCCETGPRRQSEAVGYDSSDLGLIPDQADMGLGCGNPTAIAALQQGETVVDLGSGGGIDCFLASKRVGESGTVIGVDMTPEMIDRARSVADGYANVEFRLGEIENLPVADAVADVVISNCVINLSPDKPRVFREAWRVLKPSGRLQVSDIVLMKELPESVRDDDDLLTACVAGASTKDVYIGMLEEAGFENIEVVAEGRYVDPDGGIADTMCSRHGLSQKAATDLFESIVSMEVIARKQA